MTDESTTNCGPACEEALERLESFLDGELPEEELGNIQQHLADCHPCTDRATFEEQLRSLVRHKCVDQAPPALFDRVRAHLGDAALG